MKYLKLVLPFVFVLFLASCGGGSDDTSSGAGTAEDTTASTDEAAATPTMDTTPAQPTLTRQIVVVGDSIAAGVGASTNFPSIIQAITGIPVINAGVPGISAEGGALRGVDLINRFNPRWVVALLGTNNATGAGGGINGAINSLRFLTNVANEAGATMIIGTLPPISRSSTENAAASAISGGIAGISGARIVRIDAAVSLAEITDGLHPGDSGQNTIGRLFASQVF